jgi:hypothetical protein
MRGFYFIDDHDYLSLWPVIAVSLQEEFWIGVNWLQYEMGWRSGDGGDGEHNDLQENSIWT